MVPSRSPKIPGTSGTGQGEWSMQGEPSWNSKRMALTLFRTEFGSIPQRMLAHRDSMQPYYMALRNWMIEKLFLFGNILIRIWFSNAYFLWWQRDTLISCTMCRQVLHWWCILINKELLDERDFYASPSDLAQSSCQWSVSSASECFYVNVSPNLFNSLIFLPRCTSFNPSLAKQGDDDRAIKYITGGYHISEHFASTDS
jgi:hypothetical protein